MACWLVGREVHGCRTVDILVVDTRTGCMVAAIGFVAVVVVGVVVVVVVAGVKGACFRAELKPKAVAALYSRTCCA